MLASEGFLEWQGKRSRGRLIGGRGVSRELPGNPGEAFPGHNLWEITGGGVLGTPTEGQLETRINEKCKGKTGLNKCGAKAENSRMMASNWSACRGRGEMNKIYKEPSLGKWNVAFSGWAAGGKGEREGMWVR